MLFFLVITLALVVNALGQACSPGLCNDGTCIVSDTTYVCVCPNGYTGDNCENAPDFCSPGLCNDGTCATVGDTYECTCSPFYTGDHCENAPCDQGWHVNDDGSACLKVVKKKRRTFDGSQNYCVKVGGALATKMMTSTQRRNAMRQIKFVAHFWIGFHAPNKDGEFAVINGPVLFGTLPFKKGKPKDTNGKKHCITLKKGKWHDKDCSKKHFFICQKDISAPS